MAKRSGDMDPLSALIASGKDFKFRQGGGGGFVSMPVEFTPGGIAEGKFSDPLAQIASRLGQLRAVYDTPFQDRSTRDVANREAEYLQQVFDKAMGNSGGQFSGVNRDRGPAMPPPQRKGARVVDLGGLERNSPQPAMRQSEQDLLRSRLRKASMEAALRALNGGQITLPKFRY